MITTTTSNSSKVNPRERIRTRRALARGDRLNCLKAGQTRPAYAARTLNPPFGAALLHFGFAGAVLSDSSYIPYMRKQWTPGLWGGLQLGCDVASSRSARVCDARLEFALHTKDKFQIELLGTNDSPLGEILMTPLLPSAKPVRYALLVYLAGTEEREGPLYWLTTASPVPTPAIGEPFDLSMWPTPEFQHFLPNESTLTVVDEQVKVREEPGWVECQRSVTIAPDDPPIRDELMGLERLADRQTRRADFCEAAARDMAKLVASDLLENCTQQVIRGMRNELAKGLAEEQASAFREAAEVLQAADHSLLPVVLEDLESRVRLALKSLAPAEKSALWLAYESSGDRASIDDMAGEWSASQLEQFDPFDSWDAGMPDCSRMIMRRVQGALVGEPLA